MFRIILFLLITPFLACNLNGSDDEATRVARVYDQYLYVADIDQLVQPGISAEDSAAIVDAYIEKWVADQLLLRKAELNLKEEQMNFDKQLESYRNSLIIYAYEEKLVSQKLDTVVGEEELQQFYEANKQNFELKDNIIKGRFVQVANDAPKLKQLKKWYRSEKEEDLEELSDYCIQFANSCLLDTSEWVLFSEFQTRFPTKIENPISFLRQRKFIEQQDSSFTYLLSIKDYKIESNISPLPYVKDRIKSIIVNRRRLQLIAETKKKIYEEATATKSYETYSK